VFSVFPFGKLRFLYVGSSDVSKDIEYYVNTLGCKKVWDFSEFGTRVAAVEICDGPLLLLAGHRPAPSCLPIFQVDSLDSTTRDLKRRGWKPQGGRVEIPNGPCYVFNDKSGNQLAIFEDVRPGALNRT
jgi:hypothetical protein